MVTPCLFQKVTEQILGVQKLDEAVLNNDLLSLTVWLGHSVLGFTVPTKQHQQDSVPTSYE